MCVCDEKEKETAGARRLFFNNFIRRDVTMKKKVKITDETGYFTCMRTMSNTEENQDFTWHAKMMLPFPKLVKTKTARRYFDFCILAR